MKHLMSKKLIGTHSYDNCGGYCNNICGVSCMENCGRNVAETQW